MAASLKPLRLVAKRMKDGRIYLEVPPAIEQITGLNELDVVEIPISFLQPVSPPTQPNPQAGTPTGSAVLNITVSQAMLDYHYLSVPSGGSGAPSMFPPDHQPFFLHDGTNRIRTHVAGHKIASMGSFFASGNVQQGSDVEIKTITPWRDYSIRVKGSRPSGVATGHAGK